MKRGIGPAAAARKSGVLILPAALCDQGNALAEVIGWAAESFAVALSPTGAQPTTHLGCHAFAEQAFFDVWTAEEKPERLEFPSEDFAAIRAGLVIDVRTSIDDHLREVAAERGLFLIEAETENA